nr:MAG TPA: hypothetical protein [Bacteriophage sp.]
MGKALRDYKAIAKHMVKLAYPFRDIVKFSLSFNLYMGDYYTLSATMFMEIRVNSNAFTWYEDTKGNLFYCLDTHTAFDTSNIVSYINMVVEVSILALMILLLKYVMNI